jgi:glucose-6-phosphate isomerase
MRIHFVDNLDPFTFEQLVSHVPLQTTAFLVISKSGATAETLAQCMVLVNEVKKRIGESAIKDHFIFITEQGMNPLCRMGEELDILVIHHDRGIGERFAALTAVGLLPAAVAGLDIHAIRYGAAQVVKHTFLQDSAEPALGAALQDALLKRGKSVSIMMPCCNRLDAFGVWHQQLWAESLGRGGHGTTALHVPGVCDQHSQLQLCLEGAHDKFVTLICLKQEGTGAAIPLIPRDRSLSYLKGHSLGNIAAAGRMAAVKILMENNCPLRVFTLYQMDEKTIGALMMHFMLETLILSQLWNADASSLPVVEESRKLTRDCLSAGTLRQDMLAHPRKMRMAV